MLIFWLHADRVKKMNALRSLCTICKKDPWFDSWKKYQFKNCEDVIDNIVANISKDSMDITLQDKIKLTLEEEPVL